MKSTVRTWLLGIPLLLFFGCAQKSASLQKSVVPPDQTLYETGTKFLEKGQYIRSRLALQTMINTYPDSEMTADAYYAIGDSYYEEGGTQNWLQAEQQYKDFIIFFPAHPKAPDAQMKIVAANMKMMGPVDRDQQYTLRAEQEIYNFLEMYPDHDFAPIVKQNLAIVQDKLAQKEEGVGDFYARRGNHGAAVSRYLVALDKYPDYYNTPEVLSKMAHSLLESNNPDEAAIYLDKLVSEYPFSELAEEAKQQLAGMGKPIPEVNIEVAAVNEAKMRQPQGFSPVKPLLDFGKALGFIGPPDVYEEATGILAAEKAKAAKEAEQAAVREAEAGEGIDIVEEIRKPVSEETPPEEE
ncbi:MAG: outer membrane protein assembly factor BamD [Acidobacteria bacterium]|nr:outer membrane protein assembly factor BamD [Acidobacteriota bacterium]